MYSAVFSQLGISTGTFGRSLDPSFVLSFLVCSLLLVFLTVILSKRLAGWPADDRHLAQLLPAAAAVLLTMLAYKVLASPFDDQNWSRLQRTFLLAGGYPIYSTKNAGPVLNSIYGPVSAMAYLPATLFHSLPAIMRVAESAAIACFFVPVLWLQLREEREKTASFAAFLVFALFPFVTSSIRNGAFHVHADAPALGLGALACGLVSLRNGKAQRFRFFASAVFAVLAFYAKQVMAPLFLALPLYLWLSEGRSAALRYTAWLLTSFVLFSFVFARAFGIQDLFFNLCVIPSRHPWRDPSFAKSWGFAVSKLLRESFFIGVLGFLALREGKDRGGFFRRFQKEPWGSFFLAALFLVPASLAGRAKIGGSTNALCFTVYFLLIAATLAMRGRKRLTRAALAVLLVVTAPVLMHRGIFPKKETDFATAAYAYAKKHPGEAYFPKMTLIHFLAEGKVYHEVVGLIDYQWARFPVSTERMRQNTPEHLKTIAFHEGSGDDMYMYWDALPEISRVTRKDGELPEFLVYKKEGME